MNPGDLRETISLERDVVTRVNGVEVRVKQVYGTCRAKVDFLSGNELFKANAVNTDVNVRVLVRYRTDVLTAHRVLYDGKSLEIKAVIPVKTPASKRGTTLECKG